jgi:hypothetical protein
MPNVQINNHNASRRTSQHSALMFFYSGCRWTSFTRFIQIQRSKVVYGPGQTAAIPAHFPHMLLNSDMACAPRGCLASTATVFVVLSVTFPDTGLVLAHRSLNALHASRRENVERGDVVGSQTTTYLPHIGTYRTVSRY